MNTNSSNSFSSEEVFLLKKLEELEADHSHLRHEISRIADALEHSKTLGERQGRSRSRCRGIDSSFAKSAFSSKQKQRNSEVSVGCSALEQITEISYVNILQSMGPAVCIFKRSGEIAFWNNSAEALYGYSASEALGQNIVQLLVQKSNFGFANELVNRVVEGNSWTGQFPFRKKSGDILPAVVTNTPFYDERGLFVVGVISVSSDAQLFHGEATVIDSKSSLSSEAGNKSSINQEMGKGQLKSQNDFQFPLASKLSSLAAKVTSKVRSSVGTGDAAGFEGVTRESQCFDNVSNICQDSDHREHCDVNCSETRAFKETGLPSTSGISPHFTLLKKFKVRAENDTCYESESKNGICNTLGLKAEKQMTKKGILSNYGSECDNRVTKNRFV